MIETIEEFFSKKGFKNKDMDNHDLFIFNYKDNFGDLIISFKPSDSEIMIILRNIEKQNVVEICPNLVRSITITKEKFEGGQIVSSLYFEFENKFVIQLRIYPYIWVYQYFMSGANGPSRQYSEEASVKKVGGKKIENRGMQSP